VCGSPGIGLIFLFIIMDYRKKYKDYFKIQFGKEYDIHHIDFNHKNNDIENLLLLPKDLHQRLHKVKINYGPFLDRQINVFSDIDSQLLCSIMAEAMLEISKIYDELQIWASMKEGEQKGNFNSYFNYNRFRK
jgi:hypothetical protein